MGYIKHKSEWVKTNTWECNHPEVVKMWFWGGASPTNGIHCRDYLSLLLKNGETKEFSVNHFIGAFDELIIQAEEWLLSLNSNV